MNISTCLTTCFILLLKLLINLSPWRGEMRERRVKKLVMLFRDIAKRDLNFTQKVKLRMMLFSPTEKMCHKRIRTEILPIISCLEI